MAWSVHDVGGLSGVTGLTRNGDPGKPAVPTSSELASVKDRVYKQVAVSYVSVGLGDCGSAGGLYQHQKPELEGPHLGREGRSSAPVHRPPHV